MKRFWAATAIGLSLTSAALAQPWRGDDDEPGPRYRDRGGYEYRDRGYDGRDRGYEGRGFRDDGPRGPRGGVAFDEREYLRCNPDVRRAVERGRMYSGYFHYQEHGRREGRRLSC